MSSFAQDAADAMERASASIDRNLVQDIYVYLADDNGFPVGASGSFATCPESTCVRYKWKPADPDTAEPGRYRYQSGTWNPNSINACLGDATGGQSVGVFVRAKHDWILGFFGGDSGTVTASTVMRFEPLTVDHATRTGWVEPTATTPGTFAGCK